MDILFHQNLITLNHTLQVEISTLIGKHDVGYVLVLHVGLRFSMKKYNHILFTGN